MLWCGGLEKRQWFRDSSLSVGLLAFDRWFWLGVLALVSVVQSLCCTIPQFCRSDPSVIRSPQVCEFDQVLRLALVCSFVDNVVNPCVLGLYKHHHQRLLKRASES